MTIFEANAFDTAALVAPSAIRILRFTSSCAPIRANPRAPVYSLRYRLQPAPLIRRLHSPWLMTTSAPNSNSPSVRGGFIRNGRYELWSATMVDLIARAWGIRRRLRTQRTLAGCVRRQPFAYSPAVCRAEAMEKRLGLKLQTREYPMPVVLIDQVEQMPSDN